MATNNYIKVAEGDDLRKVERDVLIPKIMKERAMERCSQYKRAFEACAKGRLISVVWACREENKNMQDCYNNLYHDEKFQDECRKEYLAKRDEYRRTGLKEKNKKATSS